VQQHPTYELPLYPPPISRRRQAPEPPAVVRPNLVMSKAEEAQFDRIVYWVGSPPEESRVLDLTPAISKAILDRYNQHNRPKKPRGYMRYSRDMTAGHFGLTGDTIKFSDAELLRDGQNRLLASVRSGCTFRTHVVFGIDDSLFDRIDQGETRKAPDLFAIAGYTNTTSLAAAVRNLDLLTRERMKSRASYEPPQLLHLLQQSYPRLPHYVTIARRIYEVSRQPIGMVAAMIYCFDRASPAHAGPYIEAWSTAKWGGTFSPIGQMQKAITRVQQGMTHGHIHETVRAAYMAIAWNLYMEGRRGSQRDFDWGLADEFPAILRDSDLA